jgi:threonylcarbamoyladenosine tRNA methylthiotransferase MtaB
VGFAGETDEDFRTSLGFMEEIGFEKVHVFPYSIRKGTRAEKLDGHLDKKVKEERCKIMIEKADAIRRNFFNEQTGKIYNLIIESKSDDGYYTGHTANYIPVKIRTRPDEQSDIVAGAPEPCCFTKKMPSDLNGSMIDVKIIGVSDEDYLIGEII